MTPTPQDHEAAARKLATRILDALYIGKYDVRVADPAHAAISPVIAAALAEAVRVAVTHERTFLKSCPWCGEEMKGAAISVQMRHLIDCGDKRRARSEAEAPRIEDALRMRVGPSEAQATPAPDARGLRCGKSFWLDGEFGVCLLPHMHDGQHRVTPPETKERG